MVVPRYVKSVIQTISSLIFAVSVLIPVASKVRRKSTEEEWRVAKM